METRNWSVEWFGSQSSFIIGKGYEPIPLERLASLKSLYAVGPLERGRGEISIYHGMALISEVRDGQINVNVDFSREAGFLVYATVENWRGVTFRNPIASEQRLIERLLPIAIESGIDVDRPFPFLLHCHIAQASFHILCNQSDGPYSAELHERAKVRFPMANRRVEIVGFYSRKHRGIFTPRDSDFHMHLRTFDNRIAGHLEAFTFDQATTLYLPASRNCE
jgi:hypothetical protein